MYASVVKSQPFRTKVIFRFFMTQDVSFLPVFSVFRPGELEKNTFRQTFPSRGVGVCRDSAVVPLKWMCLVSWQIQQHNRLFLCVFITLRTWYWLRLQQEQRIDCTHMHCRWTRAVLVRCTPRMIIKIISFACVLEVLRACSGFKWHLHGGPWIRKSFRKITGCDVIDWKRC